MGTKSMKAKTITAHATGSAGDGVAAQLPKLTTKRYEKEMRRLQGDLVALQEWVKRTGAKVCIVFEGLDSAGKGGTIRRITERTSPRVFKHIALPTPTERERSQWYFQRYVRHLPAAGELVLFDRSWYNRAGVEHVMGFCTHAQYRQFLADCPVFEKLLTGDGIILLKYWLAVDQEEQERRFAERATDPLKRFKISPVDLEARKRYQDYGKARDTMIEATHAEHAPWFVVDFNDQKRGRLNLVAHLLERLPERAPPDKPLKLPKLGAKPAREKLRDSALWVSGRF
jgi:polyphosphate kinase 2